MKEASCVLWEIIWSCFVDDVSWKCSLIFILSKWSKIIILFVNLYEGWSSVPAPPPSDHGLAEWKLIQPKNKLPFPLAMMFFLPPFRFILEKCLIQSKKLHPSFNHLHSNRCSLSRINKGVLYQATFPFIHHSEMMHNVIQNTISWYIWGSLRIPTCVCGTIPLIVVRERLPIFNRKKNNFLCRCYIVYGHSTDRISQWWMPLFIIHEFMNFQSSVQSKIALLSPTVMVTDKPSPHLWEEENWLADTQQANGVLGASTFAP